MRVKLQTSDESRVIEFQTRTISVGRDKENDLVILQGDISRFHAIIEWDFPNWTIRDLDSGNGTRINNDKVGNQPTPFSEGDTLRLGKSQLKVLDAAAPAEDRSQSKIFRMDTVLLNADEIKRELEQHQADEAKHKQATILEGEEELYVSTDTDVSIQIPKDALPTPPEPAAEEPLAKKKSALPIAAIVAVVALFLVVGIGAASYAVICANSCPPPDQPLPATEAFAGAIAKFEKQGDFTKKNGLLMSPTTNTVLSGQMATIDGNTRYMFTYKNGKPDGECLAFYEDNKPKIKGVLKNGLPDGHWTGYHANGKKWFEMNFVKGKANDNCVIWCANGQTYQKNMYENGKLVSSVSF